MGSVVPGDTLPAPVTGPPRPSTWAALAIVLVAALAFLTLGGFEAWHDSATFDEPVYVSAGVAALLHHDVADNAEHPPLFKVLAALPVLLVHPVVPGDGHWDTNNEKQYSARFVEAQVRAGTMHRVTLASRVVPLLEYVLLALALFALAAELFGVWAGVVAALLWLFDPLTLGLGHLDGVDLPFALATVLVSWAMVRWLADRRRRSLWWLGVACGVAASAQVTGLLLVGLAAVVVVVADRRQGAHGWPMWRPGVVVLLATWLVVWAVYLILKPSELLSLWAVVPPPYLDGIRYLATHDTGGAPGFLIGQAWTGANVWFWPVSVVVKVSTPVLLVLLAGTVALIGLVRTGRIDRSTWHRTAIAVAVPAVILFVFELPNPRTLGVRYLLPSLALWAVLASPIALVVGRRAVAAALAVVLAAAGVITALSYPHSIAYTAPPFRPGYRMATDSNIDWGQDLTLLTQWSATHHPYVVYFGPRGISYRDVPGARSLVATPLSRIVGWVAASTSDLTSAHRADLAWLRAYCPVGTLGGTILLYHFTTPPTAEPGPAAPAALCSGAVSHRMAGS
jgi:4-amino-4-deoxy-L-arabinose transferase-like glycosyltransferase